MRDIFATLFTKFEPHSHHFEGVEWLMWTDIVANLFIALAFVSIPIGLVYFLRRRTDMAFDWILGVFAAFIFACAVTHMLHVAIYFYGLYYLQVLADVLTALISITAAVLVWYVIPLALKIPNPRELAAAHETMNLKEQEIALHKKFALERNEFISSISHELKTPLTSQIIFTELLQKLVVEDGAEKYSPLLLQIRSQSDKLSRLIADLLDLIRSEGHSIAVDFEEVDLNALVRSIVEEQQLTTKTHAISIEGTVSKSIWADKDRIGAVLTNLISNALKYSPKADRIILHLRDSGQAAEVSVQDFGIGIDPAFHGKIFDRFFRVAGSAQKTYPGMGVGLFLCALILEQHQGTISIKSILGEGSVFTFTTPFVSTKELLT